MSNVFKIPIGIFVVRIGLDAIIKLFLFHLTNLKKKKKHGGKIILLFFVKSLNYLQYVGVSV
jgi:hypothetical protein